MNQTQLHSPHAVSGPQYFQFKSEKTMIDHIKSKICHKERLMKTYEDYY